jgi:hypothetical protein
MSVTCALWLILQLLFPFPRKKLNMSTGQAPSLLLDLAATAIAERRRTARDRDQRALARRIRTGRRDTARAR